MAKRTSKRPQGNKTRKVSPPSQVGVTHKVSPLDYIQNKEFRAGLIDRVAGKPPDPFSGWEYEHGRAVANAIILSGADPLTVSNRALASKLTELRRDGTIIT